MSCRKFLQSNLRYSPVKVLFRYNDLAKKYGLDELLQNARFKEAREACITALATLAWSKHNQKEYWITTPDRDPPDASIVWYKEHPKGLLELEQAVEVVEWERHSRHTDLTAMIESKLVFKRYKPRTILLVCIHDRPVEDLGLSKVTQKMRSQRFGVDQIWIVAMAEKMGERWEATTCIYPAFRRILFRLEEELDRLSPQKAVLIPVYGTGGGLIFVGSGIEPLP